MLINIRLAVQSDLENIYRIEKEVYQPLHYPFFLFAQFLDFCPDLFFVIEDKGVVVGYAVFPVRPHVKISWLINIAIRKESQCMGLGEKLLSYAVKKNIELGVEEIFLHVSPRNLPAISLYEKLGFDLLSTNKDYFGQDQDRNIMMLKT